MRKSNKLSAAKVSKLKSPGMYGDGDGLWLQVKPVETKHGNTLVKSWLFRYMLDGRARHMGLGPLRQVSLAKARARASEARDLIYAGVDPLEARRKRRDEARSESAQSVTFKKAAEHFLGLHQISWKNDKHKAQWESTLQRMPTQYWGRVRSLPLMGR